MPFPFTLYGANRSSNPACDFTYCYGGDWVQGKVGNYGMNFDGTSDFINIPSGSGIPTGLSDGDFSVSAWCTQNDDTAWLLLAHRGSSWGVGWMLGKGVSSTMEFSVGGYTTAAQASFSETDTWTHFVGTYDSDAGTVKIYKNGELADGPTADGSGAKSTTALRIGSQATSTAYDWDGDVDEFAIWDVQLTPAQISLLSTGSARADSFTPPEVSPGVTGSLLLYYDFEIGDSNPVSGNFPTSTTVYDVVTASFHGPTAHTGTMNNMEVADFGDWSQGYKGKYSLKFDGVNDYVVANQVATQMQGLDKFSISFWASGSSYSTNPAAFVLSDGGNAGEAFLIYPYDSTGGDGIRVYYNGATTIDENSATRLGWNHFVYVASSATDHKAYANGEVVDTDTTSKTLDGQLDEASIGGTDYFTGQYFAGKLDEVGVWNVALDTAAIDSLHSGTLCNAVSSSNLVAYYDMECDGPGSSNLKDMSGNDLSGTLTYMTTGTCG